MCGDISLRTDRLIEKGIFGASRLTGVDLVNYWSTAVNNEKADIEIINIGPIHNLNININDFNLYIGEQATGKSTICKTICLYYTVKDVIQTCLLKFAENGSQSYDEIQQYLAHFFQQLLSPSTDFQAGQRIRLNYSDKYWLEFETVFHEGNKAYPMKSSIELIDEIFELKKMALDYYDKKAKELDADALNLSKNTLFKTIQKKLTDIFSIDSKLYYIPAGRSMFSLLKGQKTRLNYELLDYANLEYFRNIESIQSYFVQGLSGISHNPPFSMQTYDCFSPEEIENEIMSMLKGEFFYSQSGEYLLLQDGAKIQVNNISSGQQEILWLLNLLYIIMLRKEKTVTIIEEPEAHLYPSLQKKLIEFIVRFANITHSKVIITTHSPYVLTAVNTLCYAGKLAENYKLRDRVEKIVGDNTVIKRGTVAASKLIASETGTIVETLIIENEGELKTELIDEVSDHINENYTKLFYLEEED